MSLNKLILIKQINEYNATGKCRAALPRWRVVASVYFSHGEPEVEVKGFGMFKIDYDNVFYHRAETSVYLMDAEGRCSMSLNGLVLHEVKAGVYREAVRVKQVKAIVVQNERADWLPYVLAFVLLIAGLVTGFLMAWFLKVPVEVPIVQPTPSPTFPPFGVLP